MKASLLWLNQYIGRQLKIDKIVDILVRLGFGCDVDAITNFGEGLENVYVAGIDDLQIHPREKHLRIACLNVGNEKAQVVTAARNIKTGDLVLFARPGAKIKGEEVKEKDFAGTVSYGMFLSEEELGLAAKSEGVIVLEGNWLDPSGRIYKLKPGKKFSDVFDCQVLDLETTAPRSDWLSVVGVAREICRIYNKGLPAIKTTRIISQDIGITIKDFVGCPLYTGRVINDVKIADSPFWLKWRLFTHGINPINNIVDVSNLIMLQFGQPLHAFDYDKLSGNKIIIRKARKGELFTTFDGTKLILDNQLMICDAEKPVALAGIVGSLESGVDRKTKNILLESAYFDPITINRASRKLNVKTESSLRFEKGVDPVGVENSSLITADLFAKYAGGRLAAFQRVGKIPKTLKITVSFERIRNLLNLDIGVSEFKNILRRLDLQPKGNKKIFITVPSYRNDLKWEADIAEEVARLNGYDKIPEVVSPEPVFEYKPLDINVLEAKVKEYFVGRGFYECCSLSIVSSQDLIKLGFGKFLKIKNPLSERYDALRPSLIINFINNLNTNLTRANLDLRLFEIGKIFIPTQQKLPQENFYLGCLCGGEDMPLFWRKNRVLDFFDAKGFLTGMFDMLRIEHYRLKPEGYNFFKAGFAAQISIDNRVLGCIGLLDLPSVDGDYYYFDVNLDELIRFLPQTIFMPLPRYPIVTRDLSFLSDVAVDAATIYNLIKKVGGPLLKDLKVFDYFAGRNLPEGKKNLGFRLIFRSEERTLKDEEVDLIIDHIEKVVTEKTGASLRKA